MKNPNKTRKIATNSPAPDAIREAAEIIKKGGVVLIPTRCLYGLAADAFNAAAVQKIFELKNRPADNPILVLIKTKDELSRVALDVPAYATRIMDRFWPGKVTLIFQARDNLPVALTAGSGKIGVRLPGHPIANAVVQAAPNPITATSANLSGKAGCSHVANLEPEIAEKVDLIIDAGPLIGGVGSTVVDVTESSPRILREGEVSARDILTVY
ncbi:MAG: threonylcarbamoyl-AMP synthase [Deltaproteobacteria bacterium]|nr:MAG: threonylcarbamoyl-AMP synthase [Deltaproteobacteria bacterium]